MGKFTTQDFIERAKAVHGDTYIYDEGKINYINMHTMVCITCLEHGDFWQTPAHHLRGHGCLKCKGGVHLTRIEVIDKAHKVHGYKYIYDKMEYVNSATKTCITCREHGDFWQTPNNHLSGQGCPKCNGGTLITKESIIKKAKEIHGDKYIYTQSNYVNYHTKMCIICPNHGEFWQSPLHHLNGQGCPKCGKLSIIDKNTKPFSQFDEGARKVHGDKYVYDKGTYTTSSKKMRMVCPDHGEFWQTPAHHLNGQGCPKCGYIISKSEDEINNFINTKCHIQTIARDRKLLGGKLECDILIPSHKLAMEFNGLKWHSENINKKKFYHLNKTELAESKGYHLIHIFEDEWLEHKDLVLSKIRHILKCDIDKSVIGARKCAIKTLSKALSEEFLNTYHLQGFSPSTALYGAFYGDVLVGAMTFKKEKEGVWNFNRFATNTDYRLPGLASKMFKQFVKDNNPIEVKAFLDRRWSHCDSNLYDKLGFKLVETVKPDYRYVVKNKRLHKSIFSKQLLAKKYNLPLTMTEKEMAEKLGYYRIWDCGQYKYVWKNPT